MTEKQQQIKKFYEDAIFYHLLHQGHKINRELVKLKEKDIDSF